MMVQPCMLNHDRSPIERMGSAQRTAKASATWCSPPPGITAKRPANKGRNSSSGWTHFNICQLYVFFFIGCVCVCVVYSFLFCLNEFIMFYIHMVVSWNGGTPKSSILMGFSLINQPFWGTPMAWKPPNHPINWVIPGLGLSQLITINHYKSLSIPINHYQSL